MLCEKFTAANILVKQADNESDGLIIETTVKPLQYYTKNFQKGETTVFETLEKYNDIIGRVGICEEQYRRDGHACKQYQQCDLVNRATINAKSEQRHVCKVMQNNKQ
ncbi:hypothetical protein PV328_011760 [Microctonus aethiopoides]|uniref:Uncharacterized protein n=1 Tax=Microctonus aethiopoides TaxID=144406 RepID=A0AA39C3J3_9HYME|nr:hypothetical protein PV328_011760 [Microctonus aethiopoides]